MYFSPKVSGSPLPLLVSEFLYISSCITYYVLWKILDTLSKQGCLEGLSMVLGLVQEGYSDHKMMNNKIEHTTSRRIGGLLCHLTRLCPGVTPGAVFRVLAEKARCVSTPFGKRLSALPQLATFIPAPEGPLRAPNSHWRSAVLCRPRAARPSAYMRGPRASRVSACVCAPRASRSSPFRRLFRALFRTFLFAPFFGPSFGPSSGHFFGSLLAGRPFFRLSSAPFGPFRAFGACFRPASALFLSASSRLGLFRPLFCPFRGGPLLPGGSPPEGLSPRGALPPRGPPANFWKSAPPPATVFLPFFTAVFFPFLASLATVFFPFFTAVFFPFLTFSDEK